MFERTITKNSLNNVLQVMLILMKAFSINTMIISPFKTDTNSYATSLAPAVLKFNNYWTYLHRVDCPPVFRRVLVRDDLDVLAFGYSDLDDI